MVTSLADVPGVPIVGDIIAGKYTVEQILGHGGMGVVVSARHLALGQLVAVKFLLPSAAIQPAAVGRFLREARSAVTIQSDHVARVLDIGTLENGVPYMVMEHLLGTDLRRVISARGRLTVVEAVDYVLQASEAIAEAHALGIIHRDLKPANLFVTTTPDGSPFIKVLDFGLSTASSAYMYGPEEATLTTAEAVMGSPPYMSPEQIRSLKSVDTRTDIWSLGVILYRLLGGKRPFVGETLPAICASIAADTPVPLTTLCPDVPPELDAIVRRCLAKEVSERIQTVAELASGIAPFGSAAALVSLNRIVKVTPGAISRDAASISASGPLIPPISTSVSRPLSGSRPLEAHDPSTANGNAWAQPPGANKRGSKFSIAILGVAIGAAVGGVIVSTQKTAAPRVASPADEGIAAAPVPSSDEDPSKSSAPAASESPSHPGAAQPSSSVSAAPSASLAASSAPAAPSAVPRSPVRPRPPAASKAVDPLERWK